MYMELTQKKQSCHVFFVIGYLVQTSLCAYSIYHFVLFLNCKKAETEREIEKNLKSVPFSLFFFFHPSILSPFSHSKTFYLSISISMSIISY